MNIEDIRDLSDEEKLDLIKQGKITNLQEIEIIILHTFKCDYAKREEIYSEISREFFRKAKEERKKIRQMSDEEKIEMYLETEDRTKKEMLLVEIGEESLIILLGQVKGTRDQVEIIKRLSEEKRIEMLSQLKLGMHKSEIIKSMSYEKKKELLQGTKLAAKYQSDILDDLIKECGNDKDKQLDLLNIALNFKNRNKIVVLLTRLGKDNVRNNLDKIDKSGIIFLRNNKVFAQEDVSENITEFMILEGVAEDKIDEKSKIFKKLLKNNDEVAYTIDFDFLDKKNLELLTDEQFQQIACYPEIQKKFVKINQDDKKIKIFQKCLDSFIKSNPERDWTNIVDKMLSGMFIIRFDELIQNLDINREFELDKLIIILTGNNDFNIRNTEQLENYEEIKESICDSIIKGEDVDLNNYPALKNFKSLEMKKFAVLTKLYGQDLRSVKMIIEKFGEDIDNVSQIDEESIECVEYIKKLKEIINSDNEEMLNELYNSQDDFAQDIDCFFVEDKIKRLYAKEFNKTLFDIKDATEIGGESFEGVYEAGTEFNMMITSVAAYYGKAPENYNDNWNRNTLSSQGFCASYIRNDMLGTAPIRHICYGFNNLSEDALMLSGAHDIYSDANNLVVTSERKVEYFTPNTQIGKTEAYNEMVLRRTQEGKRKQPDYIVVFKKDGKVSNMEEAKRAQEDWGKDENGSYKMPIVVIDVDKCLEAESKKIDSLKKKYELNPTSKSAKEIYQKVRNNRVTTKRWGGEKFREDIDLEVFKEKIDLFEKEDIQTDKSEGLSFRTEDEIKEFSLKELTKSKFIGFIQKFKNIFKRKEVDKEKKEEFER